MQVLKFYAVKSNSTSDLASLSDSPLVPSDESPLIFPDTSDSIDVPSMPKSQSMIIPSSSQSTSTDRCSLLSTKLLINSMLIPMNMRAHMRMMETTKPTFLYHFIKRSERNLQFIETTPNANNIKYNYIILRGFETIKDSRWTYMYQSDNQMRCTLKHQLYMSTNLRFNAISSPFVALNFTTVTSYNGMFALLPELETITIDGFDTRYITSMDEMFADCTKLKEIRFINCDLSSVQTMRSLCSNCVSLTSLRFENCDMNINCDYSHALYNCPFNVHVHMPHEIREQFMYDNLDHLHA